jgi:hypothetical protein
MKFNMDGVRVLDAAFGSGGWCVKFVVIPRSHAGSGRLEAMRGSDGSEGFE